MCFAAKAPRIAWMWSSLLATADSAHGRAFRGMTRCGTPLMLTRAVRRVDVMQPDAVGQTAAAATQAEPPHRSKHRRGGYHYGSQRIGRRLVGIAASFLAVMKPHARLIGAAESLTRVLSKVARP